MAGCMFSQSGVVNQRRAPIPRRSVVAQASYGSGDKVKIKVDFKVFHVPGFKNGMEIKDKEGTIESNVTDYKGVSLSPNYPWKVRIDYEASGKPKKFFVHLDEDEMEKV